MNSSTPVAGKVLRRPLRYGFVLIALALVLAWLAISPTTRAQLSPAPDGAYPSGNTAEGADALFSLTTGVYNTAIGADALFFNATGSYNTANGAFTLTNGTTAYYY